MKKICLMLILILFVASESAFAQRYHFDLNGDEQTSPQSSGTVKQKSKSEETSYKTRYRRTYQQKRYRTKNPYPIFSVELNGSQSAFEAKLGAAWPMIPNTISTGLNGFVSDEDLYIISGDITFGNKLFNERFTVDIGLKAAGGEAEKGRREADIGAVGFLIRTIYDIPDFPITYHSYIDLEVFGEFCASPSPLAFGDTDQYLEARGGLGINLTASKRSTVIIGYRYIKADFDTGKYEWEKTNDALYFGYRLRF